MLPRKSLISLKKEFPRIRKEGKIYDCPSFGLVVAYGSNTGPQASFVVSKKIDKKSVVRHEVKRKLADAVSSFLPNLNNSVELVFLAKGKAVKSNSDELKTEIESALRRARLILSQGL